MLSVIDDRPIIAVALRHPKFWTVDQDLTLQRLWTDEVPCRDIGEAIGKTKNSVIGRARRLGLEPRKVGFHSGSLKYPRKKKEKQEREPGYWRQRASRKLRREAAAPMIDTQIPTEQRKTLLQRGDNDCHFPIGDPTKGFWCNEEFFYCGGPTDGGPYCAGHAARMFNYTRTPRPPKHKQFIHQRQAWPREVAEIQGLGTGLRVLPDAADL